MLLLVRLSHGLSHEIRICSEYALSGAYVTTDGVIAITGATGSVGSRVVAGLAAAGRPQLLVVRDSARAPVVDGAEVRVASAYGAGDEMRAALEGADTLLLIPAAESADRAEGAWQRFCATTWPRRARPS